MLDVACRVERAPDDVEAVDRGAGDQRVVVRARTGRERLAARQVEAFEAHGQRRHHCVEFLLLDRIAGRARHVQRAEAQRLRQFDDRPLVVGGANHERAVEHQADRAALSQLLAGQERVAEVEHVRQAVADFDHDRRARQVRVLERLQQAERILPRIDDPDLRGRDRQLVGQIAPRDRMRADRADGAVGIGDAHRIDERRRPRRRADADHASGRAPDRSRSPHPAAAAAGRSPSRTGSRRESSTSTADRGPPGTARRGSRPRAGAAATRRRRGPGPSGPAWSHRRPRPTRTPRGCPPAAPDVRRSVGIGPGVSSMREIDGAVAYWSSASRPVRRVLLILTRFVLNRRTGCRSWCWRPRDTADQRG